MWVAAIAAIAAIWWTQRRGPDDVLPTPTSGAPVHRPSRDRAPAVRRVALPVRPPEPGPPRTFRLDRRHTGRSPYVGPRESTVVWKLATHGRVTAQPVVAPDGTIYVGSHDHFLYAVTPAGRLKWKKDLRDRVYATALVDASGAVYVGSDADVFWSFAPDGTLRWKLETEGDADSGAVEGPDGRVFFAAGPDLWAVKKDGTVDWRFRANGKIYTTPAIDDDGTLYVGSQDDHFYAVAPDGRMRWSFATHGDNDASPVLGDDGTIYFGSDDKHVYALTRDGGLRFSVDVDGYVRAPLALTLDGSVLVAVFGPRPRLLCLDGATGDVRWFFPVTTADSSEVGIASGPLVDREGNVFVGAHDDYLYAVTANGDLRWALEAQGDVDASAVLAPDGTLYVGSDDGNIYALRGVGG